MSSFVRSPRLSVRYYEKNRLDLFSDKIAEMTLKVNQGHIGDGTLRNGVPLKYWLGVIQGH